MLTGQFSMNGSPNTNEPRITLYLAMKCLFLHDKVDAMNEKIREHDEGPRPQSFRTERARRLWELRGQVVSSGVVVATPPIQAVLPSHRGSLRRPFVVVMKSTKDRHGDDLAAHDRLCWRPAHRVGYLLGEPLVWSRDVEVGTDIFLKDAAEVILTEDEDVVEALPPDTAQEALADGRAVRRPRRDGHHIDTRTFSYSLELGAVLVVVVTDEEPRSFAPRYVSMKVRQLFE